MVLTTTPTMHKLLSLYPRTYAAQHGRTPSPTAAPKRAQRHAAFKVRETANLVTA